MAKASALIKVGIGEESTAGTGVTPTLLLPVTSAPSVSENRPRAVDESFRGRMSSQVFDTHTTVNDAEISLEGPFIPQPCGWLLKGLFGSVSTTGTDPYTHAFSAPDSNTLDTYTVTVDYGLGGTNTEEYNYCRVSSLTLNYEPASYLTYSATLVGRRNSSLITSPSLTESADRPLKGAETTLTVGGSGNTLYESFSATFQRGGISPVHTLGSGFDVSVSPIDGTFQGTAIFDDYAEYNRAVNHSESTIVVLADNSSDNRSLSITMTAPDWTAAEKQPGGISDIQRVSISNGRMKYSSTDSGLAQVSLENGVSTYA